MGSPVLYYLAAAGVGTLGIVDFDVVNMSNLHGKYSILPMTWAKIRLTLQKRS